MKKLLFVSTALFAAIESQPANADPETSGFYVDLKGGAALLEDSHIRTEGFPAGDFSYKTGYDAGGSFGYHFGPVRTELEYTYRNNDVDTFNGFSSNGSHIESHAFMVNIIADIPTDTALRPYLGAGAGYALLHPDGDDSNGRLAYQLMAGLEYNINDQVTIFTGYKYFATINRVSFDTDDDDNTFRYSLDYRSHNVEAGIRFSF